MFYGMDGSNAIIIVTQNKKMVIGIFIKFLTFYKQPCQPFPTQWAPHTQQGHWQENGDRHFYKIFDILQTAAVGRKEALIFVQLRIDFFRQQFYVGRVGEIVVGNKDVLDQAVAF